MGSFLATGGSTKENTRLKHRRKIRASLSGTSVRPRVSVFRSNAHMYVQLVDDVLGVTLSFANTMEAELQKTTKCNVQGAKVLGELIAKRAAAKDIKEVVFDRSGYLYHGKIKALADSMRAAGLKF